MQDSNLRIHLQRVTCYRYTNVLSGQVRVLFLCQLGWDFLTMGIRDSPVLRSAPAVSHPCHEVQLPSGFPGRMTCLWHERGRVCRVLRLSLIWIWVSYVQTVKNKAPITFRCFWAELWSRHRLEEMCYWLRIQQISHTPLVDPVGFEPATFGLWVRCSDLLSYRSGRNVVLTNFAPISNKKFVVIHPSRVIKTIQQKLTIS